MTIVVVGIGYEGASKTLIVKGKNVKDCLRKTYLTLKEVESLDELEEDEVEELKTNNEDELVDLIGNALDPSDFVLCSIYNITNDEVIYDDQGDITLID